MHSEPFVIFHSSILTEHRPTEIIIPQQHITFQRCKTLILDEGI